MMYPFQELIESRPEQTLLQNNASARFFNAKLVGTDWRVEDVSRFLSKASEDSRPSGTSYTWREVFDETDQAIQTISRFMEVHTQIHTFTEISKNSQTRIHLFQKQNYSLVFQNDHNESLCLKPRKT